MARSTIKRFGAVRCQSRRQRRLVGRRQAEHSADNRRRGGELRLEGPKPNGDVRLGVVALEVDAAGDRDESSGRRSPAQHGHRATSGIVRAAPGSPPHGFAGSASSPIRNCAIPVDESSSATAASSSPTRIDPMASRVAEPVELVRGQTGSRDDQADQRGRVFREHGSQGRIRGRHEGARSSRAPSVRPPVRSCRTDRRNEIPSSDEGHRKYHVADDEVGRRLWREELLHAVGDRHDSTRHEQTECGEQRPDIRLASVTERMRAVRWAARARFATKGTPRSPCRPRNAPPRPGSRPTP